jgi:hypothetical protein
MPSSHGFGSCWRREPRNQTVKLCRLPVGKVAAHSDTLDSIEGPVSS